MKLHIKSGESSAAWCNHGVARRCRVVTIEQFEKADPRHRCLKCSEILSIHKKNAHLELMARIVNQ
jgi:hypothetical protein